MARVLGQHVAVGVQRIRLDAVGAQGGEPVIQQRAGHHRDAHARGLGGAPRDGEVQRVDVIGEVFLERVGDQRLHLHPAARGQVRLRQQHVRAGHQHAHAPRR